MEIQALQVITTNGGIITNQTRMKSQLPTWSSFYLVSFGCAGSSLLCNFSLAVMSKGYSLVSVYGLIAVASLVVECGLSSTQASVVAAPRL